MLASAWNPAGGIRYHMRAWRHRQRSWQPFRAALAGWLQTWQPGTRALALVGPSAGHCLPLSWLASFERLIVYEPDPLARFLLARRLRAEGRDCELRLIATDAWIEPTLAGAALDEALLDDDVAILFCNFIGQAPFLLPEPDFERWQQCFRERVWPRLAQLPWASFHDRVSSSVGPTKVPKDCSTLPLSEAEIAELYADAHSATRLQTIELLDHGVGELLPPGRSYRYFHWPLTPDQHYLVEGVLGAPLVRLR